MGFEYKIKLKKYLTDKRKREIINILKQNPAFFRSYLFDGRTRYEFRSENNTNIKNMPNFEIIFEKDGLYLLENGGNLNYLEDLKKALADDILDIYDYEE